ncbi:MAG TPA: DUF427 domain-containing protein [Chloroflexota bacterium]|nr:DUF427 domain-containing protein [Chloroflexota bacterium]
MAQPAPEVLRARDPNHKVEVEDSPRWVRVELNGLIIADTKHAKLLRETQQRPVYYFPPEDVRLDLMQQTDRHTHCPYKGQASYWTVAIGDRVAENAVWSYPDPYPEHDQIRGHLAFYWNQMDAWYEEAEQIFGHPRDPYHRVDVIESTRHVRVAIDRETVAESRRPRLLFETGHPTRFYLPRDDVRMDLLSPTETRTRCPYKGQASYWTARVGDTELADIVWSYEDPIPECPKIKGYLSFFNEKVDVWVDGELEKRPITGWS